MNTRNARSVAVGLMWPWSSGRALGRNETQRLLGNHCGSSWLGTAAGKLRPSNCTTGSVTSYIVMYWNWDGNPLPGDMAQGVPPRDFARPCVLTVSAVRRFWNELNADSSTEAFGDANTSNRS